MPLLTHMCVVIIVSYDLKLAGLTKRYYDLVVFVDTASALSSRDQMQADCGGVGGAVLMQNAGRGLRVPS